MLQDDLHTREPTQAMRAVDRHLPLSSIPPAHPDEVFYVECHTDPETNKEVVLWVDIPFQYALQVRHKARVVPFLKGKDLRNLEPLRIAYMPNIVMDVVVGGPSVNKEGSSLENGVLRRPEPILQQGDDKKDRSNTEFQDIVPTSPSSPSRRNPVYGLEETAMDNYSHIDKPLAFPSARGPQAALDDQKTAVSNPAISSQQDNDAKRSTPGPQSITTKHIKEMDLVETSISGFCGNKEAQVAIGDMYRDAEGVPLDYQRAMDWYLQAAERGDPVAQTRIGMLYYYGRPAPKDYAKSMEWCLKAAEEGHANAQTHIGDLYNRGEGVIQSYAQAMEWYLKAAHQGHMMALYSVGELYEYGRGLPQSYAKAVEWYQKATEQGHGGARNRLEELKKMGVVVH